MKLKLLTAVLLAVFISACGSRPSVQAPKDIRDSIQPVELPDKKAVEMEPIAGKPDVVESDVSLLGRQISIHEDALEKEFLLRSSVIQQIPELQFQGLKSRVVSFRKVDNSLFMLEATQGHVVDSSVESSLIIAEFKIIKDEGHRYIIDFNMGMSQLFGESGWYASDFAGTGYKETNVAVRANKSYIKRAYYVDNTIVIEQVAQFMSESSASQTNGTYQVQYYLSPYIVNKGFKVSKATNFKHTGYFQVHPQHVGNGKVETYSTKFDHRKPIEFLVSANTPEDYRKAVMDGVLYWNKAFGAEILKVKIAEEGLSAPHPKENIIQWINNDAASSAYADANSDPRTGETLNAQIFLRSSFAVNSEFEARKLIENLDAEESNKTTLSLTGFEHSSLCNYEKLKPFARQLEIVLSEEYSDEVFLKISQDNIRETVAHEVGHTLGLRHNFAGSLATNLKISEKDESIKSYIDNTMDLDQVVVSSSVMDYLPGLHSFISGSQVEKASKAMSYDEMAIRSLYYETELPDKKPLFCTDTHVATYADCNRHDSGANMTEYAQYETKDRMQSVPGSVFNYLVSVKYPASDRDPMKIEEKSMTGLLQWFVSYVLQPRQNYLNTFNYNSNLIAVSRTYPVVDMNNEDEVREQVYNKTMFETLKSGNMVNVLMPIFPTQQDEWKQKLEEIINAKRSSVTYRGTKYELTDADVEIVRKRAHEVFATLNEMLVKVSLAQLNSKEMMGDHMLIEEYGLYLQALLDHYVFTDDGNETFDVFKVNSMIASPLMREFNGVTQTVEKITVPKFSYDFETRLMAAQLLKMRRSLAPEWGFLFRQLNVYKMSSIIQTVTEQKDVCTEKECTDEEKMEESKKQLDRLKQLMSKEILRWSHENKMILALLAS